MKASLKKPTTKSAAKPTKPNPKFVGTTCEICGRHYLPHPNTGKLPRFIEHHLTYPDPANPHIPEVTAVVCLSCSNWMHGNGKVYANPFKGQYDRGEAPYWFSRAVVLLYEKKLILPAIAQALAERKMVIAINSNPGNETTH